jgi:hypothetical protein
MSGIGRSLISSFAAIALGASLFLAGPVGAGDESVDSSRQPDLKSWSNKIPAAKRFVVLADFNNEAVLDRETGLVWERSPSSTLDTWSGIPSVRVQCTSRTTGGRKGWRLPSMPELASLVDPSVPSPGPTLPHGHPFTNVQSAVYWSATTVADIPTRAWFVNFSGGPEGTGGEKTEPLHVWCVRGGMNTDAY